MIITVSSTLYGAFAAGFLVGAVFFLRLWRRDRQPLIMFMAAAFTLLAANYGLLGAMQVDEADDSWVYLLRLTAFLLIIAGIVVTNFRRLRSGNR